MTTEYESNMQQENIARVRSIAATLDNIANGTEKNEDGEEVTMFDYLEDALDMRFILGSDVRYLAGRVLVAFGGPNIWVDTENEAVELYWWSDRATARISKEAAIALDEALEELWLNNR